MERFIVVDVQNDFCPPNGSLAVPNGDKIVPIVNSLVKYFFATGTDIAYTRDWHPTGHISFASAHSPMKPFDKISTHQGVQMLWPDHCVQGTEGALLHKDLLMLGTVFHKGMNRRDEEYSAAENTGTPFGRFVKGAARVFVCGLATDYCVKAHVLSLRGFGHLVVLIEDAIAGVAPDTTKAALDEMRSHGVQFMKSGEILQGVGV